MGTGLVKANKKIVKPINKSLQFSYKSIKKRPFYIALIIFIDLLFFMSFVAGTGLIFTSIQMKLFDAVNVLSMNPNEIYGSPDAGSIEAILANSPELETLFKSIKTDFIILAVVVFLIFFISQLIIIFMLKKRFAKIKVKEFFKHYSIIYLSGAILYSLLLWLYIKFQNLLIESPIKLMSQEWVNYLFSIVTIVIYFLFFILLLYSGEKNIKSKIKEFFTKKIPINLALFILFILVSFLLFKLMSLLFPINMLIFLNLYFLLQGIMFAIYRLSIINLIQE